MMPFVLQLRTTLSGCTWPHFTEVWHLHCPVNGSYHVISPSFLPSLSLHYTTVGQCSLGHLAGRKHHTNQKCCFLYECRTKIIYFFTCSHKGFDSVCYGTKCQKFHKQILICHKVGLKAQFYGYAYCLGKNYIILPLIFLHKIVFRIP